MDRLLSDDREDLCAGMSHEEQVDMFLEVCSPRELVHIIKEICKSKGRPDLAQMVSAGVARLNMDRPTRANRSTILELYQAIDPQIYIRLLHDQSGL